ncbi:helix-turn-helix domain-containing protein [Nevskia sp.]|uniref:helix-turn-helix domain-containing protein n=1 Tax=Nevskia sp. TaxID=1929292 RepID=UPI0025ED9DDD|nr:helix-turn-helix domain-containing protein [Nevskia sp.]
MTVDTYGPNESTAFVGLAYRLSSVRIALDMSQQDFSLFSGISFSALKKYEAGTRVPGAWPLLGYLRAGANIHWVLTGDGPALFSELQSPPKPGEFDSRLMREVVEIVEQLLAEHRRVLPPAKKAELLVTLYEMFKESATPVHRATVLRLVNLAA